MNMAARFHQLHNRDEPLLLPNAWDYSSAAALVAAGFDAIGTTSLGVAAAAGLPDGEGATRAETVGLARTLSRLPVPVTVDIEAGFSEDPNEVRALAAELAEVGVAGVNLEDGRSGGGLADPGHQAELIAAFKAGAPELFLNARVDTYWLAIDRDSTIARVQSYVEAGADGVFVPGIADPDEIRQLVAAVAVPVNVLYLHGKLTVSALGGLGVSRVSTGSLLFRAALHGAVEAAIAVRGGSPVAAGIPSYQAVQKLTL